MGCTTCSRNKVTVPELRQSPPQTLIARGVHQHTWWLTLAPAPACSAGSQADHCRARAVSTAKSSNLAHIERNASLWSWMFPAPAPVSQPRWKQLYHPAADFSEKWMMAKSPRKVELESLILHTETLASLTAILSNVVVQILQNI